MADEFGHVFDAIGAHQFTDHMPVVEPGQRSGTTESFAHSPVRRPRTQGSGGGLAVTVNVAPVDPQTLTGAQEDGIDHRGSHRLVW